MSSDKIEQEIQKVLDEIDTSLEIQSMTDPEFIDHLKNNIMINGYHLMNGIKFTQLRKEKYDRLMDIATKGDSFFQDAMKLAGQVDRYEKAIQEFKELALNSDCFDGIGKTVLNTWIGDILEKSLEG